MSEVFSFLKVTIPAHQYEAHVVEIEGDFDAGWGVEVAIHSPVKGAAVDRIRDFTITETRFNFRSKHLNGTGYVFFIKLNNVGHEVKKATALTEFVSIERSV